MKHFRPSLIDLMAAVAAAALGLAWVRCVAPGRPGAALIVVGPFLGLLWERDRGGRGVFGGALGGAVYASVVVLDFLFSSDPDQPSLASVRDWPYRIAFMTTVSVGFGTLMGAMAWVAALAMGAPQVANEASPAVAFEPPSPSAS